MDLDFKFMNFANCVYNSYYYNYNCRYYSDEDLLERFLFFSDKDNMFFLG